MKYLAVAALLAFALAPTARAADNPAYGTTHTNTPVAHDISNLVPNTAWVQSESASSVGTLLDTFRLSGDVNDTASFTRAVAAGVPILLGPKTYTTAAFSTGAVSKFILKGIPSQSVIQFSGSGQNTFTVNAATVVIDGVTFDLNGNGATGVSRGVAMTAGGQNVTIVNSVFKNNTGGNADCFKLTSTGPAAGGQFVFKNNEVFSCGQNGVEFLSVSNGVIEGNYVHDVSLNDIVVTVNGSPSPTNYAADIQIVHNRAYRSIAGIHVGGATPPYSFTNPRAVRISVIGNDLQDNSVYQLTLEGDYLTAIGNNINQSSGLPSVFGAIDCNSRYNVITGNIITLSGSSFGIDCGSSVDQIVTGNMITIDSGVAINASANQNGVYTHNHMVLGNAARGMQVYSVDTDGNLNPFPTLASNTDIEENVFDMSGGSTGIFLADNPGGMPGTLPIIVKRNHFNGTFTASQAISWYGSAQSLFIGDNDLAGNNTRFQEPNGSGDVVFDNVYFGGKIYGLGSTTNIRGITTRDVENLADGGSILWVYPSAGGSGYTAATVLTAGSPCSGFSATPLILSGVIIGVRISNQGTSCTGTPTVTASDTGGGSGATFVVGNIPALPNYGEITYVSAATHLLQKSGGANNINTVASLMLDATTIVKLQAKSQVWGVVSYTLPSLAVGSLPGCNSTYLGVIVNVTGSTSHKWQAQCDGTNWRFQDGTIVSSNDNAGPLRQVA